MNAEKLKQLETQVRIGGKVGMVTLAKSIWKFDNSSFHEFIQVWAHAFGDTQILMLIVVHSCLKCNTVR
jgi:hypothetical protein